MAQHGLYAELFTVQAAGYAEEQMPLAGGGR